MTVSDSSWLHELTRRGNGLLHTEVAGAKQDLVVENFLNRIEHLVKAELSSPQFTSPDVGKTLHEVIDFAKELKKVAKGETVGRIDKMIGQLWRLEKENKIRPLGGYLNWVSRHISQFPEIQQHAISSLQQDIYQNNVAIAMEYIKAHLQDQMAWPDALAAKIARMYAVSFPGMFPEMYRTLLGQDIQNLEQTMNICDSATIHAYFDCARQLGSQTILDSELLRYDRVSDTLMSYSFRPGYVKEPFMLSCQEIDSAPKLIAALQSNKLASLESLQPLENLKDYYLCHHIAASILKEVPTEETMKQYWEAYARVMINQTKDPYLSQTLQALPLFDPEDMQKVCDLYHLPNCTNEVLQDRLKNGQQVIRYRKEEKGLQLVLSQKLGGAIHDEIVTLSNIKRILSSHTVFFDSQFHPISVQSKVGQVLKRHMTR